MGTPRGAACCVVLSCLSSMLSFVLHAPLDPKRPVTACRWARIPMDRVIAATSLAILPVRGRCVYATDISGGTHGRYLFTRRLCDPVDTATAGSCAERWRSSAEDFISARRSALGELNGKCRKPAGLESKTHMFLSCEMCRHPYYNPSLPGAYCLEVSGGNQWISCGKRTLLWSWDGVMLVGLLKPGETVPVLAGQHTIGLGCFKRAAVVPRVSTTSEVCVISLATFTIPVCRWIASETNPADDQSRPMRYRPRMHSDVDQYETSTTGLTPDSELFTVLPAEAARVAGEDVQPRKPSGVRSSTCVASTGQGRTI